ncbi:MAG: VOC family protein [Desulfocapsaceae bacterium]|nr:VOC family protein [Desulfocapsaceae bacterium]
MEIRSANTILYCTRWQDTIAFYRDGLGLEITTALDWFVEFRLNGHARLSIADTAHTSLKSSAGQGLTLAMEVEDIDATRLVLEKQGLHPQAIRDHAWGARVFYIYDPEGNRLEFWMPVKKNTV